MHILYAGCSVDVLGFVILLSSTVMHPSPAEIRQEGDLSNIFFCRHSSPGTWSDLTFYYNSDEEELIKRQTCWDLIFRWVPSKWLILPLLNLPISHQLQQAGSPEHFLLKSRQLLGKPGIEDRLGAYNPQMEVSMGVGARTQVLEPAYSFVVCWAHQVRTWHAQQSGLYPLDHHVPVIWTGFLLLSLHASLLALSKCFNLCQLQFPLCRLGTINSTCSLGCWEE